MTLLYIGSIIIKIHYKYLAMSPNSTEKLKLFPLSTKIDSLGHLKIGNCDCTDLVSKYGTPLYVFDEHTIRTKCQEFKGEFTKLYENTEVIYASKAFLNKAIAQIIKEERLGLDVVSGGEISIAKSIGFPPRKMYFHGNNKGSKELEEALNYSIGRIVVDNFYELEVLNKLADKKRVKQDILLRLSPGIDAHTHKYTTTGILDSKFGFPIATGQAEEALRLAMSLSHLNLNGLHCHLGSPIFESTPFEIAIDLLLKFASEMNVKYGFEIQELSPGGGFAVQYNLKQTAPEIRYYAEKIITSLNTAAKINNVKLPKLIIEPGRSIIAQSGVAIYSIGSIKQIPGLRTYIFVDGGMGDNIRPALYEAEYEVVVANKANLDNPITVSIAGKYCESGDILIKNANIATVEPGDIIAIPVSGAYSIPMSSTYNMIPRPAVIMVKDGKSRIIRVRETYKDLMKLDRT